MRAWIWLVITVLSLFAHGAVAADPDAGATIASRGVPGAPACVTCHGAEGQGMAQLGYPVLADLDAGYMTRQLKAFKTGARENALMKPVAESLTPEQMADVSAYYASLPAPPPPVDRGAAEKISGTGPGRDAAQEENVPGGDAAKQGAGDAGERMQKMGAMLVFRGDWNNKIPPCVSCHGPGATGVNEYFPRLAGQHAGYLVSQLEAWKRGERNTDPNNMMQAIAKRLSHDQVRAVSAYLEQLPPEPDAGQAEE